MPPSIQARIYKHITRTFIRPMIYPGVDFAALRQRIERSERLALPLERGFTRREEVLAGVPCQWITTPQSDPGRVILYLHGGGGCTRTPVTHGQMLAKLCAQSGATGLMPDYRLAPEHPFPAAHEDSLAVYRALLERGYQPDKMAFAGDSAGGGLALGLLLQARDAGLPLPACAVMFSPAFGSLHGQELPADKVKTDAVLSPDALLAFRQALASERFPDHPLRFPLKSDLSGLPPLLIQAGSAELLVEDARQGVEKARADGVEAHLQLFEGLPHVFQVGGFLPETRDALQKAGDFLRAHLDEPRPVG